MSQSLRRGLEILDFLAACGGQTSVSEAAAHLAVDRSTSSRLLATLADVGYVVQDPDTQRYRLGTKLLRIGSVLLDSLDVREASHDQLRAVARATGEPAHLAVLEGTEAVFLDQCPGTAVITVNTGDVGSRDPLYCTAVGRALLADLEDQEIRRLLADVDLVRLTPRTITTMPELLSVVDQVRVDGYAFEVEESHVGVHCLAAPVRSYTGRAVAAIGISGPRERAERIGEKRLAEIVTAAAAEISKRMGYEQPTA